MWAVNSKVQTFKTVAALLSAVTRGEIPTDALSPGGAAGALGITRQAVHERMRRGTLRAWATEDGAIMLTDGKQVRALAKRKRGIAETQGELLDESP